MSDAWPALVPEGEAAPPMAWLEAVRGAEGMSVNAQALADISQGALTLPPIEVDEMVSRPTPRAWSTGESRWKRKLPSGSRSWSICIAFRGYVLGDRTAACDLGDPREAISPSGARVPGLMILPLGARKRR